MNQIDRQKEEEELLAGPYVLTNKKNKNDRVTISLLPTNEISTKNYERNEIVSWDTKQCEEMTEAMELMEKMIAEFKAKDYVLIGEDKQNGPKGGKDKLAGKRTRADSAEPMQEKSSVKKRDEKKAAKEEEKGALEEEKQANGEPARRSGRNFGKVANYNIDDILDAAAEEMDSSAKGTSGGGCISVMLAETYKPELLEDPTGWLISEKLDGVRCYWNGSCMYTRNGHPFYPPDWWKEGLPKDLCLDGELWTGRADFQKIVSIVRRQDQNDEWKDIKYMIFDAPKVKGPFTKRIAQAKKVVDAMYKDVKDEKLKRVVVLEHKVCKSKEHLMEELDSVIAKGGEGVMLRDPESLYENRRSASLLKVKKFDDAEATVTGHERGTGRCSGMTGAIHVRGDDGIEFKIGSGFTDA
jgi:DNA ligase-1